MKVKDCMCNNVCCINPSATVKECAKLMQKNHIGCIPVCDETNKMVGIVTDRDIILRNIACDNDSNQKVSDVMTTTICYCDENTDVNQAQQLMSDNQVRRLPVLSNGKIIGMLTLKDIATNQNVDTSSLCYTFENICGCDRKNAE